MRRGLVLGLIGVGVGLVVLAATLASVGTQLDDTRIELQDLQLEIDDLSMELATLTEENADLQGGREALDSMIEEQRLQIEVLEGNITHLEQTAAEGPVPLPEPGDTP